MPTVRCHRCLVAASLFLSPLESAPFVPFRGVVRYETWKNGRPRGSRRRASSSSSSSSTEEEEDDDATARLMDLVAAHFQAQVLRTMVEMSVPDLLGKHGSTTSDELADLLDADATTTTNRDALSRCLRLASVAGVLEEGTDGRYSLTAMGRLLRTPSAEEDEKKDLASCVLHWTEQPLWDAWYELPDHVSGRDSRPPFVAANGGVAADAYYDRERRPESLDRANRFARLVHQQELDAVVDGLDWASRRGTTILDVGGHNGKLLEAIRERCRDPPFPRFLCLDLPEVVERVRNDGAAPVGVEMVPGDVMTLRADLERYDGGAETGSRPDTILLKHLLDRDMWDEERSVRLLRSCREALSDDGELVLCEAVLPDAGDAGDRQRYPQSGLQLSVDALFLLVGRQTQRTRKDWEDLAHAGGFRMDRIVPTRSPSCYLIVLVKAD